MGTRVVAVAGGVGAGKFLRGLARVVPGGDLTVVVNVADDIVLNGLRICPDPDSVIYWLSGLFDRKRGWGRADETFITIEALRALGAPDAWFNLGDLDLATHLYRTVRLSEGAGLALVTAEIAARLGVTAKIIPATEDRVETRIDAVDPVSGDLLDLHFQEYWVRRGAADKVTGVRYVGIESASPAPGVLDAIAEADAVIFCPSNPVVSIGPILAMPAIKQALASRRSVAAGVSGIVGGAPISGMADKLMPAAGMEVSSAAVAESYSEVLSGWVMDNADSASADRVREMGMRVVATDTLMTDDDMSERLAKTALGLALGDREM